MGPSQLGLELAEGIAELISSRLQPLHAVAEKPSEKAQDASEDGA
jgi:hypothetical protein